MLWSDDNLVKVLKENGVVVMPTDTLYGVVGKAFNPSVVERIYTIRKRNPDKPCIILISDMGELKKFGIVLTNVELKEIKKYKEPTSFVFDCLLEKFLYLHRGMKSLVFRVPAPKPLRDLLLKTGPLIAPSANLEGLPPAQTTTEAQKYFGNTVDLYIDGGELTGKASRIIKLHKDGSVAVFRV